MGGFVSDDNWIGDNGFLVTAFLGMTGGNGFLVTALLGMTGEWGAITFVNNIYYYTKNKFTKGENNYVFYT